MKRCRAVARQAIGRNHEMPWRTPEGDYSTRRALFGVMRNAAAAGTVAAAPATKSRTATVPSKASGSLGDVWNRMVLSQRLELIAPLGLGVALRRPEFYLERISTVFRGSLLQARVGLGLQARF